MSLSEALLKDWFLTKAILCIWFIDSFFAIVPYSKTIPSYEKHEFQKKNCCEQVLLTFNAWLYGIEALMCSIWEEW